MTHHPHIHMIVPGGGISPDGSKWVHCRKKFFLPVRVLSRLFRRLFIEKVIKAYKQGRLKFLGHHAVLHDKINFDNFLKPLRKTEWVVYAKEPFGGPPFAGPEAVLAYLSRYTHRIAISNQRLIRADAKCVTFKCKDYRIEGPKRYTTMTLATDEFIRRFLIHVLPKRFHRIRHYGLLTNGNRAENLIKMRGLLHVSEPEKSETEMSDEVRVLRHPCPCCGGRMIIIDSFEAGCEPKQQSPPKGIDSS